MSSKFLGFTCNLLFIIDYFVCIHIFLYLCFNFQKNEFPRKSILERFEVAFALIAITPNYHYGRNEAWRGFTIGSSTMRETIIS